MSLVAALTACSTANPGGEGAGARPLPTIEVFASDRVLVEVGEAVMLSWSTSGALEIKLFDGEELLLESETLLAGGRELTPSFSTIYTLIASNSNGEVSEELLVEVQPEIHSFSTDAEEEVLVGTTITLHWETAGARELILENGGAFRLEIPAASVAAGSAEVPVEVGGTFTLAAKSGELIAEATLQVEALELDPPAISSFTATPQLITDGEETMITLSWTTIGARGLSLLDGREEEAIEIDDVSIAEGSLERSLSKEGTFFLQASNQAGKTLEELRIRAVPPPVIVSFRTEPEEVGPGESFELRWETQDAMRVELEQEGVLLEIDELAPGSSLQRQLEQDTSFLLRAFNEAGSVVEARLAVGIVYPLPALTLAASPEAFDPLEAVDVEVSWTAEGAVELILWELNDEGEPTGAPLFSSRDPSEIAAGSIRTLPGRTTTYRLEGTNLGGVTTKEKITVELLLAEVGSFEAIPDEVLENGGTRLQWTTHRAERVTLDVETGSYTYVVGDLPLIDLDGSPGAQELEWRGNTCNQPRAGDDQACPLLNFPDGFTFKYGGKEYDSAKVFVDGIISFDIEKDNSLWQSSNNRAIPTNAGGAERTNDWTDMLAPMWRDFEFMGEDSKLLFELRGSPRSDRHLIIHWAKMVDPFPPEKGGCPVPLDFQVVLWEEGEIDFRYSIKDKGNPLCNGEEGTIGIQGEGGREGIEITHNARIVGGLDGKSYTFSPVRIEPNGHLDLMVPSTRTYTLTAYGAWGSTDSKTITIRTNPPPRFELLSALPDYPTAGAAATIGWATSGLRELEVLNSKGEIICSKAETSLPVGSCEVSEAIPGSYEYTLSGVGKLGHPLEDVISVRFHEPFEITHFMVTPDGFDTTNPEPVTVSWATKGADFHVLLVDGRDVTDLYPGTSAKEGTITLHPERTTRFELFAYGPEKRELSEERVLHVRTFSFTDLSISPSKGAADQDFVLSWSSDLLSSARATVTVEPQTFPMEQVDDAPFIDISADGVQVPGSLMPPGNGNQAPGAKILFPEGFRFPYFGVERDFVNVLTAGHLSFQTTSSNQNVRPLLEYGPTSQHIHIAPFWEALRSYNRGSLYTKFVEDPSDSQRDQFVVQWDQMQLTKSPIPADGSQAGDDLTFQVGLFRDGSIEFRYKTMFSDFSPALADRAGAKGAAIGFKEPVLLDYFYYRGTVLYYQPSNPINLGGLSFRYRAHAANDSSIVRPGKTTEYRVCIEIEGHRECREVSATVPGAGDLAVTELNLDQSDQGANQWFEVRNVTHGPIDLEGMIIRSTAGGASHVIKEKLVLEKGDFAVLAASAEGAGRTPDYVYGRDIAFGDGVDGLRIQFGSVDVAAQEWDESWTMPTGGQTLSLDTIHHVQQVGENEAFSRWCLDEVGGSPGRSFGCKSQFYEYDPYTSKTFIDISKSGTRIGSVSTSGAAAVIPGGLGFTIPFFGVPVNQLWVSSSGFLGFEGMPDSLTISRKIPNDEGWAPGIIAPLWDTWTVVDWFLSPFTYETKVIDGVEARIFQWTGFRNQEPSINRGQLVFQAQIYSNGDIVFAYKTLVGPPSHRGASATVGIEAIGGSEGLQHSFHEEVLREGRSILFRNKNPIGN